jgi:hypothetical protein
MWLLSNTLPAPLPFPFQDITLQSGKDAGGNSAGGIEVTVNLRAESLQ